MISKKNDLLEAKKYLLLQVEKIVDILNSGGCSGLYIKHFESLQQTIDIIDAQLRNIEGVR